MQKLFNQTLLFAAALLIAFSSCASDNFEQDPGKGGDGKTVIFRLSSFTTTRNAEGSQNALPDGTLAYFDTGRIYFTDEGGNVVFITEIVDTPSPGQLDAAAFRRTGDSDILLVAPQTIENVPHTARWAHLVGNSSHTISVGNNISTLLNSSLDLTGVGSVNHDLHLRFQNNAPIVPLYGGGQLLPTGSVSAQGNPLFECRINLTPTTARIELSAIEGAGRIASFNLRGIYLDHLFTRATVDGRTGAATAANTHFQLPRTNPALFVENSPGQVHWFGATGLPVSNNGRIEAGTNRVWALQLFAEKDPALKTYLAPARVHAPAPRLILRLDNIMVYPEGEIGTGTPVLWGPSATQPQFITVKSFYLTNSLGGGAPTLLTNIDPSTVYHIEELVFNETHLSPVPNSEEIDIQLNITISAWNRVNVAPDAGGLNQPLLTAPNAPITCNGTHTFTLGAAAGGVGSITYTWQRSPDGGITVVDLISGNFAAAGHYTTPALAENTYFRRNATDARGVTIEGNWVRVVVDCGSVLIGGVRWAIANLESAGVFATQPGASGSLFQWGRNAHWHPTNPGTGVAVSGWSNSTDFTSWLPAVDPCPPTFRLPTQAELTALHNVASEWRIAEEVIVLGFTGATQPGRIFPAGANSTNGIFLPAVGYRNGNDGALIGQGTLGNNWSSTPDGTINAWYLDFGHGRSDVFNNNRAHAFSVRCVVE